MSRASALSSLVDNWSLKVERHPEGYHKFTLQDIIPNAHILASMKINFEGILCIYPYALALKLPLISQDDMYYDNSRLFKMTKGT